MLTFGNVRLRVLLAATASLLVLFAGMATAPAGAARYIPVGAANVNDQNLSSGSYRYAVRFVLDQDKTLYKWVSGFKAQGASWWGGGCSGSGSGCYGAGTGGSVNARLVTVKADGTPDLNNILAEETFSPQTRYSESQAAAGMGSATNQLWYVNLGGVALNVAGTIDEVAVYGAALPATSVSAHYAAGMGG